MTSAPAKMGSGQFSPEPDRVPLDGRLEYVFNTDMKRKIVQTGSSLAVTLPNDLVEELGLEKGQTVELTVHPQTRAITIRTGVHYFEDGKVTKRFREMAEALVERRRALYEALAK